jgi:hypothetical protein
MDTLDHQADHDALASAVSSAAAAQLLSSIDTHTDTVAAHHFHHQLHAPDFSAVSSLKGDDGEGANVDDVVNGLNMSVDDGDGDHDLDLGMGLGDSPHSGYGSRPPSIRKGKQCHKCPMHCD